MYTVMSKATCHIIPISLDPKTHPSQTNFSLMINTTSRLLRLSTSTLTKLSPVTVTKTFSTTTPRLYAAKMDALKKVGNRENAPPKHEMVHFPGLMS